MWAAMPSGASLGGLTQGGLGHTQPPAQCAGTYRRAEVAAARAALVLHHPAPVVLAQHQQGRPAGRAHELVLDHAVGAPAQLQPDGPGSGGRGASGGTRGRTHPRHCGAARAQPGSTPPPASDMDPHFLPSDWSADAAPTTAPDAGRVRELMGGVAGHLP